MDKVEAFMSRMRGKDWNPLFDRIHIGTVRVMMGATVISGIYTVYAMFKWKQEVDFRTEVSYCPASLNVYQPTYTIYALYSLHTSPN